MVVEGLATFWMLCLTCGRGTAVTVFVLDHTFAFYLIPGTLSMVLKGLNIKFTFYSPQLNPEVMNVYALFLRLWSIVRREYGKQRNR